MKSNTLYLNLLAWPFIFLLVITACKNQSPSEMEDKDFEWGNREEMAKTLDSLSQENIELDSNLRFFIRNDQNVEFLRKIRLDSNYMVKKKILAESICLDPDFISVHEYKGELGPSMDFVKKYSRAVGAVCDKADQLQKGKYCSGTLISEDLFLTASHCVDMNTVGQFVVFNFQWKAKNQLDSQHYFRIVEILEDGKDFGLDYSILRLAGKPGIHFGFTRIGTVTMNVGDSLTIIQHPMGRPKEVEAGKLLHEFDGWIAYNDIDTETGSSGSGILNAKGELVGVHTNGGCNPYPSEDANSGISVAEISKVSNVIGQSGLVAK